MSIPPIAPIALAFLTLVLSASEVIGASTMTQSEKTAMSTSGKTDLEPLFTAVLQHRSASESDAVVSAEGRAGTYIGGGDGTATGKHLEGTVHWSLWSENCLYPTTRKGHPAPDGLHLCTLNPGGFIETRDGARIRFDGRGYGLRTPEKYHTSMTLVFGTEDARYTWLTHVLGAMEGEFDEKTGRAVWHVYLPADSHS
jgi:hypothetical protein